MDRKAFLQNSARIVISLILVLFVSLLARKKKITLSEQCAVQPYCKNCRLLTDCDNPLALKHIKNGEK